jgi:hypothetical protein
VTAMYGEQESLLHLRKCDSGDRERGNGRCGTGASAEGIQGVAALQYKHGEQQRAERSQRSVSSSHTASYTRGVVVARRTRDGSNLGEPGANRVTGVMKMTADWPAVDVFRILV